MKTRTEANNSRGKKESFIERNVNRIFVISIILGLIFAIIFLVVDAKKPIYVQKQNLLAMEKSIAQDFTNITEFSNTDMYISKNNIRITIQEKDCKLVLLYDKSWNLEEKDFVNTKISSTFWSGLGFVMVVIVLSITLAELIAVIISVFLPDCSKRNRKESEKEQIE